MINYQDYNTSDPFMLVDKDYLFESNGIPNLLKQISKDIFNSIIKSIEDDNIIKYYSYDYDKFNTGIAIEIKNSKNREIYATSEFGIYNPLNNKLKECKIIIYLNKGEYSKNDLERVITHELLHIYEIYNRIIGKSNKDLQWRLNNNINKIKNKYDDKFIQDFCYLIYLSTDQEINARVAETYTILIDDRTDNKDSLLTSLKLTRSWKYSEYLIYFDYKKYKIDYSLLSKFLVELNTSIKDKFKDINFNIYKIPNSEKECREILKYWSILFKKKGHQFQSKLNKIVDEVINDVKMIESAYIHYDDSKYLSNKYVLKFDTYLERNSKILKIIR